MTPIVVKVGGSLYDGPDLGPRLKTFLAGLTPPILIVPGGGPTADVIREFDRVHNLGEEAAHWLALRACTLNGHLLAGILGNLPIVTTFGLEEIAVIDLEGFASTDEQRLDHWPHSWEVTSDSMAVRVANVMAARELILLKSTEVDSDWSSAASRGFVDPFFPTALARTPELVVRAVNFRRRATS